jgi:hypothetical protein
VLTLPADKRGARDIFESKSFESLSNLLRKN